MSLPLTRRITRAAAMTAVGAAALAGAAGTASAVELSTNDLPESIVLDSQVDENTLDHTVQQVPAGEELGALVPVAQELAGSTAGGVGAGLGDLVSADGGTDGSSADAVTGGVTGGAGDLLGGLPLG